MGAFDRLPLSHHHFRKVLAVVIVFVVFAKSTVQKRWKAIEYSRDSMCFMGILFKQK
jgi:hypothetical protein